MVAELFAGIWVQINSFFKTPLPSPKPQIQIKEEKYPDPSVFVVPSSKPALFPSKKPAPAVKSVQTKTSTLTSQSVLQALNEYRSKNGAGALMINDALQRYAQERADYLKGIGKLDKHAGHQEFMRNGGFEKLGFNSIAENQSWNFKGDTKGLIESFYGKSAGHNKNQLNPEYTHVGIGINGAFTNLVFGGRKK